MAARIANGVLFQLVWFACVGGGATGRWWLGPIAALAFALWQVPRSPSPRGEVKLMAAAVAIGLALDSSLLLLGLVRFPHPGPWTTLAPIWIVALWAAFALTLNHSMIWLRARPLLAAAAAALFAPLSYWGAASVWGAVTIIGPVPVVLGLLGLLWAAALPLLLWIARRSADRPGGGSREPASRAGSLQPVAVPRTACRQR